MTNAIQCDDLEAAIEQYEAQGYLLNMIFPADAPREAVMSRNGEALRLQCSEKLKVESGKWATGRAGMEYRDLIPDRLGGKVIASHIRLPFGGEVPDYVHYHKVDFQLIYCLKGRIKVVYEDQGPPFWLETGDCVIQPPEIRHRVLEYTAGAEVIEVSMPAEHETWVEHEITLPTSELKPDRDFGGQRFFRYIAANYTETEQTGYDKTLKVEECCQKLTELLLIDEENPLEVGSTSTYYEKCCRSFAESLAISPER